MTHMSIQEKPPKAPHPHQTRMASDSQQQLTPIHFPLIEENKKDSIEKLPKELLLLISPFVFSRHNTAHLTRTCLSLNPIKTCLSLFTCNKKEYDVIQCVKKFCVFHIYDKFISHCVSNWRLQEYNHTFLSISNLTSTKLDMLCKDVIIDASFLCNITKSNNSSFLIDFGRYIFKQIFHTKLKNWEHYDKIEPYVDSRSVSFGTDELYVFENAESVLQNYRWYVMEKIIPGIVNALLHFLKMSNDSYSSTFKKNMYRPKKIVKIINY